MAQQDKQASNKTSAKDVIVELRKSVRALSANQLALQEENDELLTRYNAMRDAVFALLANQLDIALAAGNQEYAADFAGAMFNVAPNQTVDMLVTATEYMDDNAVDRLRGVFSDAGLDFDDMVQERAYQRSEMSQDERA